MTKKYHYIYKIKNKLNNKFYIGRHSTDDLNDNYPGSGSALTKAREKYGNENFEKRILCFCDSFDELCEMERYLVSKFLVARKDCYNLKRGGSGEEYSWNANKKFTEKQKKNMKGRKSWNEGLKLKPLTEDHKKKISNKISGITRSDEYKKKMSESLKGRTHKTATCPHCGINCTVFNLSRWHGDNCKHKEN